MQRERITQNKGPTLDFIGEQIASVAFESSGDDPMEVGFEIWRTQGGALIAATSTYPLERAGVELTRAVVVEPQTIPMEELDRMSSDEIDELHEAEVQRMQFAVLDHFEWHDRAKSMVRKLKWKTTRKVA